ncbi:hypothetical protein [Gemmatimonas aurantiaca]|uniref:TolB family protein n=1 Tax=Gemmatimonas aurantiaca TaxID=173480 RepID=UPI00301DD3C8
MAGFSHYPFGTSQVAGTRAGQCARPCTGECRGKCAGAFGAGAADALVPWCCALVLLLIGAACHRASPQDSGAVHSGERLAPGVLSRDREFIVAMSLDAREAVLSRRTFEGVAFDRRIGLVWSERTEVGAGSDWSLPRPLAWSDSTALEIDPVVMPGTGDLLFNSTRGGEGRGRDQRDFDIWIAPRERTGWGAPRRLPAPVNSPVDDYFATIACNGTLYFARADNGPPRRSAIFRSRPVGGALSAAAHDAPYAAPESLAVINVSGQVSNAAIAADESLILLVDTRASGQGDSDLYVSARQGTSWSEPVPLRGVNTAAAEFAPAFSPDGQWLFFARMQRGRAGEAPIVSENVYAIRLRDALPLGIAVPGMAPRDCRSSRGR